MRTAALSPMTVEDAFLLAKAHLVNVPTFNVESEAPQNGHGFSTLAHSMIDYTDFWIFVEQLSGGRAVAVGRDGTHLTQYNPEQNFIEALVPAFREGLRDPNGPRLP